MFIKLNIKTNIIKRAKKTITINILLTLYCIIFSLDWSFIEKAHLLFEFLSEISAHVISLHFYFIRNPKMTNGCPFCHVSNNWAKCPNCGKTHCNACGKAQDGTKRRATNVCPYCGKNVSMKTSASRPDWAKY